MMTGGIMHTESLQVIYSSKRATKTVAPDFISVINGFHDVLTKCNWSVTGLYASCDVQFPFFVPSVDGGTTTPKRVVGCGVAFITVNSTRFVLYDGGRETPDPASPCSFVAMGTSETGTLVNLTQAITLTTAFDATYSSRTPTGYVVHLVAKLGGPELNYADNTADPKWGTASTTVGGGYEFSTTEAESPYSVKIRTYPNFTNRTVQFDFTANGGIAQFNLDTGDPNQPVPAHPIGNYTIIANPHQFLIHNEQRFELMSTTLFACSPHLTAAVSYAVCVVGVGMLNNYTWFGVYPTATAVDSPLTICNPLGGWPRLLQFRCAGTTPLTTPNGKPLFTTAYITFGKSDGVVPAAIIGIVWDGLMCSDVIASADPADLGGTIVSGVKFLTVGYQTGATGYTRSSFLLAIPITPDTDPKTGTCNLFGQGVTRLTGSAFTAADVGRVITINGKSGTILSVEDGDHLTLTQPLDIIAGGTFVIAY